MPPAAHDLSRHQPLSRAGTHANLFSNIAVGAGSRVFNSGGAKGRGAHSGGCGVGASAAERMDREGRWICSQTAAVTQCHWSSRHCGPLTCPQLFPGLLFPAGANNTWYNIHSSSNKPIPLPPCSYGPLLTFIGNFGKPKCECC